MLDETRRYAKIQIQDSSGVWRDRGTVINDSQYIRKAMASAQMSYPKFRIRAVDFEGGVIDILTR
jgi:hypothetical protein